MSNCGTKRNHGELTNRAVVACAIAAAASLAASLGWAADLQPPRYWVEPPNTGPVALDVPVTLGTFQNLAAALLPAVVQVETHGKLHDHGPGTEPHRNIGRASGFVVHPSGLVVTNEHVVAEAEIVKVILYSGKRMDATIVGKDPQTDLALLQVIGQVGPLPAAPLGRSEDLQPGQWVVAIGNPFGLSHSVTAGIVSGLERRNVKIRKDHAYAQFIQTDAYIHKGSSGGPLIDARGTVVGVNTAIRHEGITLAIPVEMVKAMLPMLAQGRVVRSWMGVQIKTMSYEQAEEMGLEAPQGAVVTRVQVPGPAHAAGLQDGDVVVAFDGRPVKHGQDLPWLASIAGVGRTVQMKVLRDGREKSLTVTLAEQPVGAAAASQPADTSAPPGDSRERRPASDVGGGADIFVRLGLQLEETGGGVRVRQVTAEGAADRAGARAADIVHKLNGSTVASIAQAQQLAAEARDLDFLDLVIERDGNRFYIPIELR